MNFSPIETSITMRSTELHLTTNVARGENSLAKVQSDEGSEKSGESEQKLNLSQSGISCFDHEILNGSIKPLENSSDFPSDSSSSSYTHKKSLL